MNCQTRINKLLLFLTFGGIVIVQACASKHQIIYQVKMVEDAFIATFDNRTDNDICLGNNAINMLSVGKSNTQGVLYTHNFGDTGFIQVPAKTKLVTKYPIVKSNKSKLLTAIKNDGLTYNYKILVVDCLVLDPQKRADFALESLEYQEHGPRDYPRYVLEFSGWVNLDGY